MGLIKKIMLVTSGGNAPGENAAIRAVVRSALFHRLAVVGARRGYEGLVEGDLVEMDASSVSNIIQRGGNILKSSRSERFRTAGGRAEAFRHMKNTGADALVLIGGDGSFAGLRAFSAEHKISCVAIPKTIDNDLYGTDFTIGFDSALNTAMEAVDKIRDTAESHNRLFLVEVMGRDTGFIALNTGIAAGAEAILVPETHTDIHSLMNVLEKGWNRKKSSMIVVVAEGEEEGGAYKVSEKIKHRFPDYDMRVCILGHLQRGGSPTCADRLLASKLGAAAVDALLAGKSNVMVGEVKGEIGLTPLEKAVKHRMQIHEGMHRLMRILSA